MAKPKNKKKKSKGRWELYNKSGDKLERKNKSCPKCGPGTFMAKHSNRNTCGACRYTEFSTKEKSDNSK
jgi:ubiquitin-small subunit ribosomal protein S27Ae